MRINFMTDSRPRNVLVVRDKRRGMGLLSNVDPVLVFFVVVMLLLVFAFYLLLRRTVTSFIEGLRQGKG